MQTIQEELARLRERLDQLERRPSPRPPSAYLNETHASRHIGRHDEYLRRLRLEGKGPRATKVGRQFMYKVEDLDQHMAELADARTVAAA